MSDTLIQSTPRFALRREAILGVTLVLLVVSIGSHLPVPGLDLTRIGEEYGESTSSMMARLSIMALGVLPLYTVLLHVELFSLIIPPLARWRGNPQNAGRLDLIVVILALLLTAFQATGLLFAMQESSLVRPDSVAFVPVGVASFVASTAVLIWLAKMIRLPSLGSGFWLLLVLPGLVGLPQEIASWIDLVRTGAASAAELLILVLYIVGTIALVVFVRAVVFAGARRHYVDRAAAAAMMLWPIFVATTAAGYLIIPLALISEEPDALLRAIPFAAPILAMILIPLIAYAYARLFFLKRLNEDQRKALMPVLLANAGAQVIVFAAGLILSRSLQLPFSLTGSTLIVLTMVMLALRDGTDQAAA
ncbi:hypothetical protein [Tianweitania sp.]|uniref:hypothetical protein n=1 Tax=Tianweitania sp. TaxID=2021634 RepID=UPI0028A1CFC9|nr:hypothetical protein [Tianweitania sp.]